MLSRTLMQTGYQLFSSNGRGLSCFAVRPWSYLQRMLPCALRGNAALDECMIYDRTVPEVRDTGSAEQLECRMCVLQCFKSQTCA